jgi:hypothetical protein
LREAQRRHERGSTSRRGYGARHQRLRKQWAIRVAEGVVNCARCGGLIAPGEPFDLGHDDQDRSLPVNPEHVKCNRATAGRGKHRASRGW